MTADALLSPTPYQLLPRLGEDEFEALRADIAESGIAVPIDVDEHGVILDGHHRAWIAAELGVDCPRRVVAGLTEQQKRNHARRVNALRRSLTVEQRREQVAQMRAEGESIRSIGTTLGIPKSTVARDLDDVSHVGHVSEPSTITDTLGRKQPAKKALHECQACGSSFTRPVWHCDRCDEHWDVGQNCDTCADTTVAVDTQTGAVVPPPEPTTKKKERKQAASRRPLPDAFFELAMDLEKKVAALVRLTEDDRFPRNADQVAAKHRSDLVRAAEALAGVLDRLNN